VTGLAAGINLKYRESVVVAPEIPNRNTVCFFDVPKHIMFTVFLV
jgi:hypothetical protein